MTVKDLIEQLAKYSQDTEVCVGGEHDVESIESVEYNGGTNKVVIYSD